MKNTLVVAALLLAPAALPAGLAVEPSTTLSVTAQWLILAFAPTTVEVSVKVESLVTCQDAKECFVWVMGYSEKYRGTLVGAVSGDGVQVAASAAWMPGVDIHLLGDGMVPSIRVDMEKVVTSQTYGSYHVVVVFGARPAVYNITMSDWTILTDFRYGSEGVHVLHDWEFNAGASAFLWAGAGVAYHRSLWLERGFLGVFKPFDGGGPIEVTGAAGYVGPSDEDWCTPVGADALLIGVYALTCGSWKLHGPAGRWDFSVVTKAQFGFGQGAHWLVWLDEAPPVV